MEKRIFEMENELRQEAIAAGYDPDEIVSTEFTDQDGNRIEMPIWQSFYYG